MIIHNWFNNGLLATYNYVAKTNLLILYRFASINKSVSHAYVTLFHSKWIK